MVFHVMDGYQLYIAVKQTTPKLSGFNKSAAQFFQSNPVWFISDGLFHASVVSWQVSWQLCWSRMASFTLWRLVAISQYASVVHMAIFQQAGSGLFTWQCQSSKYSKRTGSSVQASFKLMPVSHIANQTKEVTQPNQIRGVEK